ncbi:MAG: Fic family protein [Actinomycetota bacterium]
MRGTLERHFWRADPALHAPSRYRKGCEYETFTPLPLEGLEVALPGEVAASVAEAERAIGELNRRAAPELAPLARLLLRTESIASSRIEGLQVDAASLARAEAESDAGHGVGPRAAEVLGSVDAMEFAIQAASSRSSIRRRDLEQVHAALMKRSPTPHIAGLIRSTQGWIGGNDYNPCGSDFVPPPPEALEPLLDDLCRFCNRGDLPPLVQAAIAHAQFETIHPFGDGNGRTGRALVQVLLRLRRLAPAFVPPISVALSVDRDAYIGGLTRFREDRIPEWLEMFSVASARAAFLAGFYLERVRNLQEEWRSRLRAVAAPPRADAAAWAVIDILPAHPVISVALAVAATGRTKAPVNEAFPRLVDAGVLRPLRATKRNRLWEADGLLDLIVGLESGLT